MKNAPHPLLVSVLCLFACAIVVQPGEVRAADASNTSPRVAVLAAPALDGLDAKVVEGLTRRLEDRGMSVSRLQAGESTDRSELTPGNYDLYVIPPADEHPISQQKALEHYVDSGGHLLVLGNLPHRTLVGRVRGEWVSPEEFVAGIEPERYLYTFEDRPDLGEWRRATNTPDVPGGIEVVAGGPGDGEYCAKAWTEDLQGWNTFYAPRRPDLFAEGHSVLTFWARTDERTDRILVEIDQEDGSRWMAVVEVGDSWEKHVLTPDDFSYWQDSSDGEPDGGLQPQNADQVNFGLAKSHIPNIAGGRHVFWIDNVGTAPAPPEEVGRIPRSLPTMEALYPLHKVYPLEDVRSVRPRGDQHVLPTGGALPAPQQGYSPIGRPQGKGIDNNRKWRWMPLADARDADGRTRGNPAWMLLNLDGPHAGSIFAGLGYRDIPPPHREDLLDAAVRMAERLTGGLFLAEGGSGQFSYWPGESVTLGASVRNFGSSLREARVEVAVHADGAEDALVSFARDISVEVGEVVDVSETWNPDALAGAPYRVEVILMSGDRTLDSITHEIGCLRAEEPSDDQFVSVRGGNFYLEGEKWYPVGINYWPLYVGGMRRADFWAGWLKPRYYAPALVEKDLRLMKEMGMNMVSIQMQGHPSICNLLDFLRRCERHDIKVMGFLQNAAPHNFKRQKVADYIREAKLSRNPALFAYDIIWEPGNWMFRTGRRDRWDDEWRKWIKERYGSIEKAEEDWNFSVPRENGKVTSPSRERMRQDGPWRVMVAAYRRFMKDLMSRFWNRATTAIREIDPNHMVTNRQGNILPQDFTLTATAKHVDFFCPEGYAIPHGEKGYNASGFFTRYIHFVTRGKPILWLEFGQSVVGRSDPYYYPAADALESQADYHEQFHTMVLEAGANGTAPWWWPGGYRVGEQSDYGIINPDGTPRPAGSLLEEYSAPIRRPREYPAADTSITVDTSSHPGGYWHLTFNRGAEAYDRARQEGKNLGIRTKGTGTTSVNTPLMAVGGTSYDGYEPLEYLDAEFNYLEVRNADGEWVPARDGASITVSSGPVRARASVGNIEEATWVAPRNAEGSDGAVRLASTPDSDMEVAGPIERNTPYLHDADLGEFTLCDAPAAKAKVELRLHASGRAFFGEARTFRLVPE